MLMHNKENFESYPSNKVVAIVDDKYEADEAIHDLSLNGFDESKIDESVGSDGLKFLDPDGRSHGWGTKVVRMWQNLAQGEEYKYLNRIRDNLKRGHAVVSVPVKDLNSRIKAAKILAEHNGKDIRYYGQLFVEHLDVQKG